MLISAVPSAMASSAASEDAVPRHETAMEEELDSEFMNALLDRMLSTDQSDEEGVPFVSESSLCSVERVLPAVKIEEGREIARKAEAFVAILEILVLIPGSLGERWAELAAESPKPRAVFKSLSSEKCFVRNGFSEGAGEIRAGENEEGREEVDRRTIETSASDVVR